MGVSRSDCLVDKGMKADSVHLREKESFQQPDIHENDSPTPNVRPSVAFLLVGMPLLCPNLIYSITKLLVQKLGIFKFLGGIFGSETLYF